MANQFVRSYTSDPGAGQRFIVGLGPSKQTGGILGFGLTPEESAKMRRQKLAQSMGLEMQGVENLPEQSIVQMGVQSQRQRQEYAQRAALQQQEQEAEERERSAKMDALKGLAKQRFAGKYTPVEIDQLAQGGVLQQMVMGGFQDEHKEQLRTMQEAAKQKQAEAYARAYPDPEDQQVAFNLALEGNPPRIIDMQIKTRMKEREQAAKEQQKVEMEQAKRQQALQQGEAYVKHDPELLMRYRAIVADGGDPAKAVGQAVSEKSGARKEELDRQERMASVTLERSRFEYQEATKELAPLEKAMQEAQTVSDTATINELAPQYRRAEQRFADARQAYISAMGRGMDGGAGAPVAQPAPGPGTPAPAPAPPTDQPQTDKAGVKMPESKVAEMSLPPTVRQKVLEVGEGLARQDRARAAQYAKRVKEILARLPYGISAPPEILAELDAVMNEFAWNGGAGLETVE